MVWISVVMLLVGLFYEERYFCVDVILEVVYGSMNR